jgi:hypothetical protein
LEPDVLSEVIHQIYGTHCTYGSSAIERRSGASAEAVVGCSARAGSLDVRELMDLFARVRRFFHYHLPSDAPDDLLLRLKHDHAPRRLIYCPAVAGLRVLGQVAFRERDANPQHANPGSYFGHLLIADAAGPAWDLSACLRLWNAPGWRSTDGPDIAYELPAFPAFDSAADELLQGREPPDLDAILERLLQLPALPSAAAAPSAAASGPGPAASRAASPARPAGTLPPPPPPPPRRSARGGAGAPGADGASGGTAGGAGAAGLPLVPARWMAMPVARRRELFRAALTGYLEVAAGQRKSLLLVAEPELVVLMVHAVARLLPGGDIRGAIGFSTYETNPDRLATPIAGIGFYQPATDLPQHRYQREFVIHTYLDRYSQPSATAAVYVRLVWDRALLCGGLAQAGRIVAACEAAGFSSVAQLDLACRGEQLADMVLNPAAPSDGAAWNAPDLHDYVRCRVGQRLADARPGDLAALAAAPTRCRTVLELTAGQPGCETQTLALIGSLDAGQLEWYLNLNEPSAACRAAALRRRAQTLEPGEVLRCLTGGVLAPPRRRELLPHLLDRIEAQHLPTVLALPDVPPADKQRLLARLAPAIGGDLAIALLSDARLPAEWKLHIMDHPSLLEKIPNHRIGAVLMDLAQHPECGAKAFRTRALIERLPEDQIVNLLLNSRLPAACREVAFDQRTLFERMPGRDLTRLLCATTVSAALKEKTLHFADVFRHIHASSVLDLLKAVAVPAACKNGIAVAFAEDLPDDDVPHLLALPEIDLAIKQTALKAHAARLTCRHLAQSLQSEHVPAECKTSVTESDTLLRRAMEKDPVELLQQEHVPVDCRRAIGERLDAETLSPEQIVLVLAVDGVPEDRKAVLLACRAGDLASLDIARLLASRSIPEPLKQQVLQIRGTLERLEEKHVILLLSSPHIPDACVEPLLARLPKTLTLDHVVKILLQGKISQKDAQGILSRHLKDQPARIVPLLNSRIPENLKAWVAEFFMGDLPDADFKPMIANDTISDLHKGAALNHFWETHQRLPANCEELWIEELGGARWRPGAMAEFLRQADGSTVERLIDKERPNVENLFEPPGGKESVQLSLYVSLFRAAAASRDEQKIRLLCLWGRQLLKLRKQGAFASEPQHPDRPFLLHRILEALLPHLNVLRPLAPRQEESLAEIAVQVLEDTTGVFQYQPEGVERHIKLLSHPRVASLFNEEQMPVAVAWGRVKTDLQELGKLRRLPKQQLEKLNGMERWNELRDDLLQQLHAIFPAWAESSRLSVIAPVARSYGVDARQLLHEPESLTTKLTSTVRSYESQWQREKRKQLLTILAVVGSLLLVVAGLLALNYLLVSGFFHRARPVVHGDLNEQEEAPQRPSSGDNGAAKPAAKPDSQPVGSEPAPPKQPPADPPKSPEPEPGNQAPKPKNESGKKPVEEAKKPILLRIAANTEEPPIRAEASLFNVEFTKTEVSIRGHLKLSDYDLVAVHGLDLINARLKNVPRDYDGVQRLSSGSVKSHGADENARQTIEVKYARGDGNEKKLLDFQFDPKGLGAVLPKEQVDSEEARKLHPVCELLQDVIIELKDRITKDRITRDTKYISLRKPTDQGFPLAGDTASVNLGRLLTTRHAWQDLRVQNVFLWDQRLMRWQTLSRPPQPQGDGSWLWQYSPEQARSCSMPPLCAFKWWIEANMRRSLK